MSLLIPWFCRLFLSPLVSLPRFCLSHPLRRRSLLRDCARTPAAGKCQPKERGREGGRGRSSSAEAGTASREQQTRQQNQNLEEIESHAKARTVAPSREQSVTENRGRKVTGGSHARQTGMQLKRRRRFAQAILFLETESLVLASRSLPARLV